MITKFVLNTVLHNLVLSWIISSKKQIKYYTKENNHPDLLNKGPWYNTAICSKLCRTLFDNFRNDRTDICNNMCSITAHEKLQSTYVDDASSIGGRAIPKNAKTAALESLGST